MNKAIIIISLITILVVIGCAPKEQPPVTPEVKDTAITQTDDAITEADKTLENLEDAETDAELDDIEGVLEQI